MLCVCFRFYQNENDKGKQNPQKKNESSRWQYLPRPQIRQCVQMLDCVCILLFTPPYIMSHCSMLKQYVQTLDIVCILLFTPSYVMPHLPTLGQYKASWVVWRIKCHTAQNLHTPPLIGVVYSNIGRCEPCPEYEKITCRIMYTKGKYVSQKMAYFLENRKTLWKLLPFHFKYLYQTYFFKHFYFQSYFLNSISIPWQTRVNARWWICCMFPHYKGIERGVPQAHHRGHQRRRPQNLDKLPHHCHSHRHCFHHSHRWSSCGSHADKISARMNASVMSATSRRKPLAPFLMRPPK